MDTTYDGQPTRTMEHTTELSTFYKSQELLLHFLRIRREVKVNLVLFLIFKMYDFDTKKEFKKLSKLLYKENCYRERVKFLVNCRFYFLHPQHLYFITKNIERNRC